jgi:hypothetical protein
MTLDPDERILPRHVTGRGIFAIPHGPLRSGVRPLLFLVRAVKRLQFGRLDAYLAYMLIALVAVIAVVAALGS